MSSRCGIARQRGGTGVARWAHNPEVDGSKPSLAMALLFADSANKWTKMPKTGSGDEIIHTHACIDDQTI